MWGCCRLEKLSASIKCSNLLGKKRSSHWNELFPLSHSSDNRMSPGEERKSPAIWRGKTAPDLPKQNFLERLTPAQSQRRAEPGGVSAPQMALEDLFQNDDDDDEKS